MRASRKTGYTAPFFTAYFFYYTGYCVFSSFIVLYLTHQGYSASLCGLITSFTLAANLVMEPVGGYITDTFLTTRCYLTVCAGTIIVLCLFCACFSGVPARCLPALIVTAGLSYPFSQLMDAWVNCCRELDPGLIYSRVRAGGSIGFAAMSVAAGYYFHTFGWGHYFLVQALPFLLLLPLLLRLPKIELGNRDEKKGRMLSLSNSFQVLVHNRSYLLSLLICTLYWFSHRPVGSFLSLIVEDRAGDSSTYGTICGVGSTVECLALLALAFLQKRNHIPLPLCMTAALTSNLLRPLCICLLPDIWSVYLGQITQSVSFSFFFSGSVECFVQTADPRIRSFCISFGLTASSVAGTVLANLLGGWLCDQLGTDALVSLSLAISAVNCVLFFLCFQWLFPQKNQPSNSLSPPIAK